MKPCSENERLQAYLDGELDAGAESSLRRHLAGCVECAEELALYERVFASLALTPMPEPPPHLTERILERVLPSQVRRRWMRALGWGYGVAAAGSLAASVALLIQPGPRGWIGVLGVEASQRVAQATLFVVDSLAMAVVHMAGGLTLLQDVGLRLSPVSRAVSTLLARPGVDVTLALATLATAGLMVWLRPRELRSSRRRVSGGGDHVGLLAL